MKTIVVKNFRSISVWDYTDVILNFRNFDCIEKVPTLIEKVPTHEVSGKQKYRVTLFTTRESYDLRNLDEAEANLTMERLLAFSRVETQFETLTITINPDKLTIEET